MGEVRLHTSSAGLDPALLEVGRDLVLHLDPAHGTDAPQGTYVFDFLDAQARHAADRAALDAVHRWRALVSEALTVDGVDWSFVWVLPLYQVANPAISRALALRQALSELDEPPLVLADSDPHTARLAAAVREDLGVRWRVATGARPPTLPARRIPPVALARRLRRAALRVATGLGAPSVVRRGSAAVHPYWPLMPVLDRMLADRRRAPALFLDKRPAGLGRSIRMAMRGGWIGLPTVTDRHRARAAAGRMAAALRREQPLSVGDLELGPLLHPQLVASALQRAPGDVAESAMLRRAFRSGRPRWVLGSWDIEPRARLVVLLAQEAGVRTLSLCHGAYLLPQPLADLDLCDEVALWCHETAPPITNWDRPIHVVGYPLPYHHPPPTRSRVPGRSRIVVLGQVGVPSTCVLDERITMRSYDTALKAIFARFPDASVCLRPHPSQDREAFPVLRSRFPDRDLREETAMDIIDLLRGVDLCIAGASTATLQGALTGTSVIALNLSGSEWPFPLGGDSAVPVARSAEELDSSLEEWQRRAALPGREDLLKGLGADGSDGAARVLSVLDGGAQPSDVGGAQEETDR